MALPVIPVIAGIAGTAIVASRRIFFKPKEDGTITVTKPGDDIEVSPQMIVLAGVAVGAWLLFKK